MLFCWSLWKKSETDFEELGETLGRFSTTFPPFVSAPASFSACLLKFRHGIFDQVCVLNLAEIFVHPEPPSSLFYLLSHQGKPYTKDLSSWLAANFLAKHFVFTFSQNQIPTFMSAAHPWSLPYDTEKGGGSRSGAVQDKEVKLTYDLGDVGREDVDLWESISAKEWLQKSHDIDLTRFRLNVRFLAHLF